MMLRDQNRFVHYHAWLLNQIRLVILFLFFDVTDRRSMMLAVAVPAVMEEFPPEKSIPLMTK